MRQVRADEIKIGDRLNEIIYANNIYGHYTNIYVVDIQKTKAGRFKIFYTRQYVNSNNEIEGEPQIIKIGYTAIKGNTLVDLY